MPRRVVGRGNYSSATLSFDRARVRFLRTACPACWLLGVSRLIASQMVFRAQGKSPASGARELGLFCFF